MKRFKEFAAVHPLGFTFGVTLLLVILQGGSAALAALLLGLSVTGEMPQLLGKLVTTAGFLALIWRLGWLRAAGITHLGHPRVWLITLVALVYLFFTHVYAFFGDFSYDVAYLGTSSTAGLNTFLAGVGEEIVFRGLVLYVLLRQWDSSRWGRLSAVVVTAFVFGALHLFGLLAGRPQVVLLQVLNTFVSAIWYGAFVVRWRSVWPAILVHGALNVVVTARALSTPGFAATADAYLLVTLLELPLVIYGIYLIVRTPAYSAFSQHPGPVALGHSGWSR